MPEFFVAYLASSTNKALREHWTKRKRARDEARLLVTDAARRAGVAPATGRVDLIFTPVLGKGVPRRDTSNYSTNVKHLEDALVDAGLLPDDRGQYVGHVIMAPPEIDRQGTTGTLIEMVPAREGWR